VDLRDGCRRERLPVEIGEHLLGRAAESPLDYPLRLPRRERRHLILQLRELVGDLPREQISPSRYRLAKLHEYRAELLESLANPDAQGLVPLAARKQSAHPAHGAEKMRRPNDLLQPVADEYSLDGEQSKR